MTFVAVINFGMSLVLSFNMANKWPRYVGKETFMVIACFQIFNLWLQFWVYWTAKSLKLVNGCYFITK